jgi:hypothetical protein
VERHGMYMGGAVGGLEDDATTTAASVSVVVLSEVIAVATGSVTRTSGPTFIRTTSNGVLQWIM